MAIIFFSLQIIILSALAGTNAILIHNPFTPSAATKAQIKFAIENKYDQTGPGAKKPEYAYKTFTNLDDALVAYIDDPDTKLPEAEKYRAYYQLLNKPEEENYSKLAQKAPIVTGYRVPDNKVFYQDPQTDLELLDLRGLTGLQYKPKAVPESYKFKKIYSPKQSSLRLSPFRKEDIIEDEKFNPNPHYTYSYGVHVSIQSLYKLS